MLRISHEKVNHVQALRDLLVADVHKRIERVKYTGHSNKRLPGHASLCIEAVEGEALLFILNQSGMYANTGSACASKALKTSLVLVAIGIPPDLAQGSVVFALSSKQYLSGDGICVGRTSFCC